jgi:hypothetical protein
LLKKRKGRLCLKQAEKAPFEPDTDNAGEGMRKTRVFASLPFRRDYRMS